MRHRFRLKVSLIFARTAAVLMLVASPAGADTVTLQGGRVLTGLVTRVTKSTVFLSTRSGEYVLARRQVKSIARDGPVRVDPSRSRPADRDGKHPKVVHLFHDGIRYQPDRDDETQTAALLPSSRSQALTDRPKTGNPATGDASTSVDASTPGPVTLYGTSWCGYCRMARRYLRKKGVAFEDLDIEKDPQAARELARVERRSHLGPGIPVIVVGGTVIQGFDRAALDAALSR